MPGSAAHVCLNLSQYIVCINESNIFVAPMCPNETLDTVLNPSLILLSSATKSLFTESILLCKFTTSATKSGLLSLFSDSSVSAAIASYIDSLIEVKD